MLELFDYRFLESWRGDFDDIVELQNPSSFGNNALRVLMMCHLLTCRPGDMPLDVGALISTSRQHPNVGKGLGAGFNACSPAGFRA